MCLWVPDASKKLFSLSESGDAIPSVKDRGSKSERMLGRGRENSMMKSKSPRFKLELESLFGSMYATFLVPMIMSDLNAIRAEIKNWERCFQQTRNRPPTVDDIKKDSIIGKFLGHLPFLSPIQLF